jgi:hypothetical protein
MNVLSNDVLLSDPDNDCPEGLTVSSSDSGEGRNSGHVLEAPNYSLLPTPPQSKLSLPQRQSSLGRRSSPGNSHVSKSSEDLQGHH